MEIYLKGKVLPGAHKGRELGFPTLNIAYDGEESGVYAGRVKIDGKWYGAAVNLGGRPTVDEQCLCEVHVLEWNGEAGEIEVELLEKVREVQKFESLEELKEQIEKDVEYVKTWYTAL